MSAEIADFARQRRYFSSGGQHRVESIQFANARLLWDLRLLDLAERLQNALLLLRALLELLSSHRQLRVERRRRVLLIPLRLLLRVSRHYEEFKNLTQLILYPLAPQPGRLHLRPLAARPLLLHSCWAGPTSCSPLVCSPPASSLRASTARFSARTLPFL